MSARGKPFVSVQALFLVYLGSANVSACDFLPKESEGAAHRPGTLLARRQSAPGIPENQQAILSREKQNEEELAIGSLPNWQNLDMRQLPSTAEPPGAILPFKLNFPIGYRVFDSKNYMAQTFWFYGPNRKDASHGSFLFSLIPKQEGQSVQDSPEEGLAASLSAIERTKTNFTIGKIEVGSISGIRFVRQHWSGLDRSAKLETSGVFYFGRRGNYLLMFSAQDREPHAVALAESAFCTLRIVK